MCESEPFLPRDILETPYFPEWDYNIFATNGGVFPEALPAPAPVPSGLSCCENCGADDWDCDEIHGHLVCQSCGLCGDTLMVHMPSASVHNKTVEIGGFEPRETVRGVAFTAVSDKSRRRRLLGNPRPRKYERIVYLRERLRQWFMHDASISSEDWVWIEESFRLLHGAKFYIPNWRELRSPDMCAIKGTKVLSSTEVRSLLRTAESLIKDDDVERREGHFLRLSRKWLVIRHRFSGLGASSRFVPGDFVEIIVDDWKRVEAAFQRVVQHRLKRKSFPYLNEVIRNLMILHDFADLAEDFPSLKTRRALNKTHRYWWAICKYWKWPFLCKTSKNLALK